VAPKIFFTADTHFNHANIIKYCARPFASAEEMNRELIARWNSAVKPEDTVYHLGDFGMGGASGWASLIGRLNGARKILILGNHDKSARRMIADGFSEAHETLELDGWLLRHTPVKTERKLLCGHIHEKWRRLGWTINAGVDVWDFTPRTLEELLRAEESPAHYKCRHCGAALKFLDDNSSHHDGKCVS